MAEFAFTVDRAIADEFSRAFVAKADLIAEAATRAFAAGANAWKNDGRANIAAAGFGKKWQNALRGVSYPDPKRGKYSMKPAMEVHHNIPYSAIYETGGVIQGNPFLWLPLPNIEGLRVGRSKISPKSLSGKGVILESINRPGKPPLLSARINLSAKKAKDAALGNLKLSLSNIVSGKGKKEVLVPLFVGINRVNIRKRFNIAGTTAKAQQSLSGLYDEAMGEVLAKRT